VLPFGKTVSLKQDIVVISLNCLPIIVDGEINTNFTNTLQYKEKVNAVYTQYGVKFNKFSVSFLDCDLKILLKSIN
jgi:hypothetical protein